MVSRRFRPSCGTNLRYGPRHPRCTCARVPESPRLCFWRALRCIARARARAIPRSAGGSCTIACALSVMGAMERGTPPTRRPPSRAPTFWRRRPTRTCGRRSRSADVGRPCRPGDGRAEGRFRRRTSMRSSRSSGPGTAAHVPLSMNAPPRATPRSERRSTAASAHAAMANTAQKARVFTSAAPTSCRSRRTATSGTRFYAVVRVHRCPRSERCSEIVAWRTLSPTSERTSRKAVSLRHRRRQKRPPFRSVRSPSIREVPSPSVSPAREPRRPWTWSRPNSIAAREWRCSMRALRPIT